METQFIDLTGTAIPYAHLTDEQRSTLARFSAISSQAAAAPSPPVRTAAAPRSSAPNAPARAVPSIAAAPAGALPLMSTEELHERISLLTAEATDDCKGLAKHLAGQSNITNEDAREVLRVAAGPRCSTFAQIIARVHADHGKTAAKASGAPSTGAQVGSAGQLTAAAIFASRRKDIERARGA